MTIREAVSQSAGYLAPTGVDAPRLAAELLLGHVLGLSRPNLYVEANHRLTSRQLARYRRLVERRAKREPLQHILGSVSFCGLELEVGPHVLIPRPETELLAEKAWKYLENHRMVGNAPPSALDFGTGSGCLAIALGAHVPGARLDALDISPQALKVAQRNAARYLPRGRIGFYLSDGFRALPRQRRYDLIVGNPPYVASPDLERLQPEVRDYDPRLALDGGLDGLDFYRRLAVEAGSFLRARGRLLLEFGDGQETPIQSLFRQEGWKGVTVEEDYSGRPRFLAAEARL